MALREIKWLRMTYSCWRQSHQKYKGEMDKSRLKWTIQVYVMFFIHKHDKWREKVLTIPLRA